MAQVKTAVQLKEEGNALFAKKKYMTATQKYSQAIRLDGRNAVLYANRAACHLHLEAWAKAEDDARKALEIDPGYTKAWARLATAEEGMKTLSSLRQAVASWERALAAFPKGNLTPAESKQKDEYQIALGAAKRKYESKALSDGSADSNGSRMG